MKTSSLRHYGMLLIIIFITLLVVALIVAAMYIFMKKESEPLTNATDTPGTKNNTSISDLKCKEYVDLACQNPLQESLAQNSNIIGFAWKGRDVPRGFFPHMVFIHTMRTKTICGGSLISENFVLTAAHCGIKIFEETADIILGLTTLNKIDEIVQQQSGVAQVYFYDDPDNKKSIDDISLVKLKYAVEFNEYVRPICLNTKQGNSNADLIAAGWGQYEGGIFSITLRMIDLEVIPDSKCSKQYPDKFNPTSFICAGNTEQYQDVCQGDSGGPLQKSLKSGCSLTYELIGVISYGMPCEDPAKTNETSSVGIYAKVAHYISWIEKTVWP